MRLTHPRWRSILIQTTTDPLVQSVLYKPHSTAELAVQQGGTMAEAPKQGTFVGASMADEGLERFWPRLNWLQDPGPSSL